MTICIYTKTVFTDAKAVYILQRFFGSKWVSRDIACNAVQSSFEQTIDIALEEGLGDVHKLLACHNDEMDGGKTPFVVASRATRFETHRQGWATGVLRKFFPEVAWGARPRATTDRAGADVQLSPRIGGKTYFRGLLKAAFNLLGANSPDLALMSCFDSARNFILNGVGDEKKYIRWLNTSDRLPIMALGPFDHFIGIYSNGAAVDGIVQFFGGISHIVRLTDDYSGPDFRFGYQSDPLCDSIPCEIKLSMFNPQRFPRFDDGHASPGPAVWPVYGAVYSRFLENYVNVRLQSDQRDEMA
ncbi:MAG: hypothetical protein H7315_01145 [Herminiimonas sp.]|nr:hypothetical protein [Herminiimonas sp.]